MIVIIVSPVNNIIKIYLLSSSVHYPLWSSFDTKKFKFRKTYKVEYYLKNPAGICFREARLILKKSLQEVLFNQFSDRTFAGQDTPHSLSLWSRLRHPRRKGMPHIRQ